ncbi:DUF2931 family protein [Flavobacterium sp. KACC 22763]|uniref:DUF2931 family protein n=1 Tax=Flavobacterium sp. KACC 22763 TaxID=3025668 RepID=UPI002365764E|nr:DUF2931 family protein [Flavobacterium sp. KACC 22763]WDF65370.1 DUF2931 family protein [Flavobacterium sp. KACC 22763]
MHPKVSFFLCNFLIIGLFVSCQPKDTFDWNAGLSGPKNYPSGAPFVEYFYQGKSIAGASSGTGADQGWGITSGGYVGGDKYKPVPDSMAVKWVCSIDNLVYRGGFKLPREKILELFKKKVIDSYGVQNDYGVIVAGMAPGGNITLWMQGGDASTEIAKFKILKGEEDQNIDDDYKKKEIKSWGNYLAYWKIHGIPYSIWEKEEKEYDYDIAFSSEEEDKKDYSIAISGYTKDGSVIYSNEDPIPYIKWNENVKLKVEKGKKLPVQFWMRWHSRDGNEWYESQIVLPINLDKQLLKFQEQYGKDVFLAVGMDKVSKNKPYTFGRIWFENSKEKIEIMKFRASKFNLEKNDFEISQYSLPKDFVFPKWQGREPIQFPEFDYWQEK